MTLARKIVLLMILSSAILSVLASAVQLYLGFERDRGKIIETLDVIESSFKNGFENALWEFDFEQTDLLMRGVETQPDVIFVGLVDTTGRSFSRGEFDIDGEPSRTIDLSHDDLQGQKQIIGKLTVQLSLQNALDRIWSQIWILLLSNFAKTCLASLVMLAIFGRFVSRHLKAIAEHVSATDWLDTDKHLILDRRQKPSPDEIDGIANAINLARSKTREDYQLLQHEVRQRTKAQTDLVRKARELEDVNRRLTTANREQADFTYAISHDMKSPTNTLNMLLREIALVEGDHFKPDSRELHQHALDTTDRMLQTIDGVLDYARTVEAAARFETVDLNELISQVCDDLAAEITRNAAIVTKDDLPAIVGHPMQLKMLFQNLISNGLKFRSEKPPLIEISADDENGGHELKVSIKDNGIGIEPQYHQRIFDLFQRLHARDEYPGTGIGLTLCQRIVTNHSGHIAIESTPGSGTTIHVTFRKNLS